MDRQKRYTAAGGILRIIFILRDSPIKEKTQIQVEKHLRILINTAFTMVFRCIQNVHSVKVFKLADDLRQLRKISRGADVNHADIHLCIKNPCKRLKLKKLIHQSAIGIVRGISQTDMGFSSAAYPFQKF